MHRARVGSCPWRELKFLRQVTYVNQHEPLIPVLLVNKTASVQRFKEHEGGFER